MNEETMAKPYGARCEGKPVVIKVQKGHEKLGEHVADFFKKLGHDVKVTGEMAIELPIEIAFAESGAGGDR